MYFETIYIYKPRTSRIANSEKYIICLNFHGCHQSKIDNYLTLLDHWNKIDESNKRTLHYLIKCKSQNLKTSGNNILIIINSILDLNDNPEYMAFIEEIKKINHDFIDKQIKNISETIHLIHVNKTKKLTKKDLIMFIKKSLLKCLELCLENNIPTKIKFFNKSIH